MSEKLTNAKLILTGNDSIFFFFNGPRLWWQDLAKVNLSNQLLTSSSLFIAIKNKEKKCYNAVSYQTHVIIWHEY